MNEIADRLHDPRAAGQLSELRPSEIGELVAVAIPARNQEQQHVVGKIRDGRRPHIRRRFIRLARIVNDEAIGECHEAGGNLDARDAIAKVIDVGVHRKRRIGVDPIGREQVSLARGMDVELKEHRRLSRALECYVKARFDQHEHDPCPVTVLSLERSQLINRQRTAMTHPDGRPLRRRASHTRSPIPPTSQSTIRTIKTIPSTPRARQCHIALGIIPATPAENQNQQNDDQNGAHTSPPLRESFS